jgi:hypothetical protein
MGEYVIVRRTGEWTEALRRGEDAGWVRWKSHGIRDDYILVEGMWMEQT